MAVDKDLTFKYRDEYNRKPIAKKIIHLLTRKPYKRTT